MKSLHSNRSALLKIRVGAMGGDRSGRLLIGANQFFSSVQSHLPCNTDIYRKGQALMKGELRVEGVTIRVEGELLNTDNITIMDGGELKDALKPSNAFITKKYL